MICTMKNSLYFLILAVATITASCNSFLDIEPESDILPQNYWKDQRDANAGVIAIYNAFSKVLSSGLWNWGEIRGDNYDPYDKDGAEQRELIENNIPIDNGAAKWTNLYNAISKANAAIKYLPSVNMDVNLRNDYLAEAYALRAWSYFYCVRVWGDVPLYLEPIESISQGIYRTRESKNKIINEVIIPDLKRAYDMIDKTRESESSKRSRVNVGTVCVLMMDVYAWIHAYDMVIQVKEQLINALNESQWRYLTPGGSDFAIEWRKMFFETTANEASREVYFRMAYDRYGNGTNSAIGYFAANSSSKLEISSSLQQAYASSDKRGGSTQWVHLNGAKRLRKKFWDDNTVFSGDGRVDSDNDLVVYRYADVILLYAEALCMQGRTEEAVTQLNRTYTRAGNTPLSAQDYMNTDKLIEAILAERRREFVAEGKRWFDLVRTGRWSTYSKLTDEQRIWFPIHRDHLLQNPNLEQNPGYARP